MAKNYKKYASGGRFKGSNISRAGIQQMQNQSQIVTGALESQKRQLKSRDDMYTRDLGGKLKREAQNRKELQDLENKVKQRQQEATALRGQREVESLKRQADQYRQQSAAIQKLTPKLAKNLQGMANNIMEYADIQYANNEFAEMQSDGRLGTLRDFWNSTDKLEQQTLEDLEQQRINAIQTGDRTTFDYLSGVKRNNSKHLQRLLFRQLENNFASVESDFLNFARDEAGVQVGANVKELYAFRAHEWLRQHGISHKSPTGMKVLMLFDSKSATKEYQFKLERDKLNSEKDERTNTETLRSEWGQSLGPNYTADDQYQAAQTHVKGIVLDRMGMPATSRSGSLAPSTTINPLPSFVEWAKTQAYSPRYRDNPDLFKREVLGITNGQNGYILPTSRGNEKPTPIFDKLEYLEAEIMGEFGKVNKDLRDEEKLVTKAKERLDAKQATETIASGKYEENFNSIYQDIKDATPAGKKVYYNFLHFHAADGMSQNTVNHVLQAAQQGDFSQFIFRYDKLTKEEKEGTVLLPFKKTMDALEQVAGSYDAIESKIKTDVSSKITAAVKENMIDQTRHDTATQAAEAAQLWFYNKYRANSKIEDPNDRYITTLEQLEDQLGLGEAPTDGIVGKGLFKNRPGATGENKTVFVMFSDADARGETMGERGIDGLIQQGKSVPAILSQKNLVSNGETRLLAEAALRGTDNIVLPKNLKYILNNYYPKGTNAHHVINQYLGLQGFKTNMPASAHDFAEYVSGGSVKYDNMAAALTKQYIENSGYSRQPVPKPAWMTLANPIYQDLLRRQYPEYYNE